VVSNYLLEILLALAAFFMLIWYNNRLINKIEENHSEKMVLQKPQQPEADLCQDHERLQLIMEATNDGIWDWDIKNDTLFWSDKLFMLLGLMPGSFQLSLEFFYQLIHEEDQIKVNQAIQQHLEYNQPYKCEMRLKKADGSYGWFLSQGKALRDVNGYAIRMVGLMVDISDRKQAEEALRQSETKLAAAQRVARIGNWELDVVTRKIVGSEELFRIFGFPSSRKEYDYQEFLKVCLPEDQERLLQAISKGISEGQSFKIDFKAVRKDGSIIYNQARGEAVFNSQGRVIKLFGTVQDITERKQLEELLQSQVQKEEALNRVIQIIRNSLDLSTIFSAAVTDIGELLEVEQVAIVQYLPEQECWLTVAEYRQNSDINSLMEQKIIDRENPITSQLKKLKIVQLNDASICQDEINHSLAQTFPGAWLLIPLHFNSVTWGSLSLVKPQQYSWQESEIEIAREIADQLAMAIYQSELYHQVQIANEELKRLATIDGLTQIANRRRFDEYLNLEWFRLRREKASLSLILFDIDFFKLYNDTYGHLAGDDCLHQVAIAISEIFRRPADLFARYGGEEFAVILPYTNLSGATHLAELIRQAIHDLEIPHSQSLVSNYLTVSLGVACLMPDVQLSPQDLINAADQALYIAKQQGRDRVAFSENNRANSGKNN